MASTGHNTELAASFRFFLIRQLQRFDHGSKALAGLEAARSTISLGRNREAKTIIHCAIAAAYRHILSYAFRSETSRVKDLAECANVLEYLLQLMAQSIFSVSQAVVPHGV